MPPKKDSKSSDKIEIDYKKLMKLPKDEPNFLESVYVYFEKASKYLDIPEDMLNVIKMPALTLKVTLKVTMDDGKLAQITSYRCQHNHHVKPCKGGVRISPTVDP